MTDTNPTERAREALQEAHDAIAEYYRYWTGGETRGSYDGKPERARLWKAQQQARTALASQAAQPAEADGVEREAGWTYEYDSGAGWETHVVLNTQPNLPTKRAPAKHYGSSDIRNVRPFYYAATPKAPATDAGEVDEDTALLADGNSWYSAGQIEEIKRTAIIESGGILPCKCGTTPHLSGDNATPDDGYRTLFCSGCLEHVEGWHRDGDETISAWNNRREKELAASTVAENSKVSATPPAPTSTDAGEVERLGAIIKDRLGMTNRAAEACTDAARLVLATPPAPNDDLRAALEAIVSVIEKNGDWDDGCFYYNQRAASELQTPLRAARAALKENRRG